VHEREARKGAARKGAAKRSTKRSAKARKASPTRRRAAAATAAAATAPSAFGGAMHDEGAGREDMDTLGNDELMEEPDIDLGDDEGGDDDLEGV